MVSFRTCPRGSSTTWPPSTGALRVMLPALLSASEGLCSSAPGEEWEGGVGHDGDGEGGEEWWKRGGKGGSGGRSGGSGGRGMEEGEGRN